MEKKQYLECGQIVNTHGIRGEVKLQPWCDEPEFIKKFKTLYISGKPYAVSSVRMHKECAIIKFADVDDINEAMKLKGKIVEINRDDAKLPKGSWFIQDIIGLPVYDEQGAQIGILNDVFDAPAGKLYEIKSPDGMHLVPDVPEFIKLIDPDNEKIVVSLIEGM